MHQLRTEEKAALLLAEADDDDDDEHEMNNSSLKLDHDNVPIVAKRPKTHHRHRTNTSHPVLCFTLILGAFVLGCASGVVIMLYRMSQDAEQGSSISKPNLSQNTISTDVDLSIRTKMFQSISTTNFMNLNRSMESETDAANKVYEQWKSFSPGLIRTNKLSYEINLAKLSSPIPSNGIELLDGKNGKVLSKVDALSTETFLSFSTLVKSGTINSNSTYYVNYGRQEDFAYLFQNKIFFQENDRSIVFMRRKPSMISATEQIRQAIHYRFAALVLFDDHENERPTTTGDHQSFFDEWRRYSTVKERADFLDGISNEYNRTISVLPLSYDDVQRIFASLQPDSNQWLSCPSQWHQKGTQLKLGGPLSTIKLRLTVMIQDVTIQLPVLMASIRSTIDPDHFVLIGYQLGNTQQNRIINEIIQAYTNAMHNGWTPKRSILFCAWSGLDYDHYTIRHWLSENSRLVDRYLIAYLDLGNGVTGNSTLNLHGSTLLEQVAHHAADSVASPLTHDHTCHHRQTMTTTTSVISEDNAHEENHHNHGRRRRQSDHEESLCEPHKLLDEWIRASKNQIGTNNTLNIVQMIDIDSSAALFQLQHGIPSLLIEMTDQQALTNDTFYVQKSSPVNDQKIEPEVYVAYTQFVCELIRQLIDEPLIPFNLTLYADQIDKYVTEYLNHYQRSYLSLGFHLGDPSKFTTTVNDLTKSMRNIQLRIDQLSKNDYVHIFQLNKQLIEFERLFIIDDRSHRLNTPDKTFKHILIGSAIGLTNTAVPFPSLSNILLDIPNDPPTELCDTTKLLWSQLKENIQLISRTLNGIDGLLTNNK